MESIYKKNIQKILIELSPVEGESPLQKLKRLTNYENNQHKG